MGRCLSKMSRRSFRIPSPGPLPVPMLTTNRPRVRRTRCASRKHRSYPTLGIPRHEATTSNEASGNRNQRPALSRTPLPHSPLSAHVHGPGMGRTIPTYRIHLESILNDWMDYRRALREKDREAFDRIVSMARQHASAASYCAHIDPTILAILSVLLEMEQEIEALKRGHTFADLSPGEPESP